MDNIQVGKLIRRLRAEKNMTQREIADQMGITEQAVSKWERGLGGPDISLLPELSTILGVNEDDYYVTIDHEMSREHYISFVAYVGYDRVLIVKLYPQQDAELRFPKMQGRRILAYCNQHGLWEERL
ncbi:MAG: helix-turn-helix domain-containing protein [Lachnospiraceae bacterium]|nr:helix-turn-helix domain-containing protein [Lachnospiraceae bacterium]